MAWVETITHDVRESRLRSAAVCRSTKEAIELYQELLGSSTYPVLCAIGLYEEGADGKGLFLMRWRARDLRRNNPGLPSPEWLDSNRMGIASRNGDIMRCGDCRIPGARDVPLAVVCRAEVPGWDVLDVMPPVNGDFIARMRDPSAPSQAHYEVINAASDVLISFIRRRPPMTAL